MIKHKNGIRGEIDMKKKAVALMLSAVMVMGMASAVSVQAALQIRL